MAIHGLNSLFESELKVILKAVGLASPMPIAPPGHPPETSITGLVKHLNQGLCRLKKDRPRAFQN